MLAWAACAKLKLPGQYVEEKSVGLPAGLVIALSSSISAGVSAHSNAAARARRPARQASPVAAHALRPSPNSAVGRTLTAQPPWRPQRSATSAAERPPCAAPIRRSAAPPRSSADGPVEIVGRWQHADRGRLRQPQL